jgi:hypothetical protein
MSYVILDVKQNVVYFASSYVAFEGTFQFLRYLPCWSSLLSLTYIKKKLHKMHSEQETAGKITVPIPRSTNAGDKDPMWLMKSPQVLYQQQLLVVTFVG